MSDPRSTSSSAATDELVAEIDQSCRWPVLVLLSKSVGWLILGLALAILGSIKLHAPGFLADFSWLTVGRIRPVAMNALVYGFATQAALAAGLWMLCRLGRTRLLNGSLIVVAAGIWNLALCAGVLTILMGHSSGFTWLEMPRFVAFFLFVAYTLIAVWGLISFHYRRERETYVSVWYILAALFWFPWMYSVANYLLLVEPVRGVMQSVVNAWYTNNLLLLWLGPIGLASIYYFIPKLAGRPLYSRSIAVFGFWTMAIFAGCTGLTQLVGGPLPAWMPSFSIAASLLMLIPLVCVGMNWHLTLRGKYGLWKTDSTMAFVLFAAICYVVGTLESLIISTRSVAQYTQFTLVQSGWIHLMLLGFVGGGLFGAIHYMVPRVLRIDWPEAKRRMHFMLTAGGVGLCFVALTLGGWIQGCRLSDPGVEFISTVKSATPFLGLSMIGLFVILLGQLSLASKLVAEGYRFFFMECCGGCCAWLSRMCPSKEKKEVKA